MMDAFSATAGGEPLRHDAAREKEQGYACGYATCTLEGNGLPPFPLHPKPGARSASGGWHD
jgi:hypothetical protein